MTALQNWLPGDQLFLWGVNLLVQATLITVAALWAARCCRGNPALKWGILSTGLLLVLLSPGIVLIAQRTGIGLISMPSVSELATRRARNVSGPMAMLPAASDSDVLKPSELAPWEAIPEFRPVAADAPSSDIRSAEPQQSSPVEREGIHGRSNVVATSVGSFVWNLSALARCLVACLLAIWCCGTFLFLIRLFRAWWKLQMIRRNARSISSKRVRGVLRGVCHNLQMASIPRITASTRVSGPLAVGVWRPELILPEGLPDQLNQVELHSVLTHEVAHIARRDLLIVFGQNLAASLFWLHPLVHALNRELALAREEVCDNYVLGTTDAPSYSRVLLRLAELLQAPDSQLASASLLPGNWKLETRIAGILSQRRSRMTCLTRKLRLLVMMLSAALGIAGAHATMSFSQGVEQAKFVEEQTPAAETDKVPDADSEPEASTKQSGGMSFRFAGRVVSPEGTPVAGAKIYFAVRSAKVLATTDEEGRFEFERRKSQLPNRAQWGVNLLVAVADGYGPAWLKAINFDVSGNARRDWEARNPNRPYPKVWENSDHLLKLVADDIPIRGRIIDLEGRPVQNVVIQPRFIDQTYARFAFHEAKTNARGEFEVRGVGRGRTVRLVAKGDHTAFSVFFARTEQGETITRSSRPIEGEPMLPGMDRTVRVVYSATFVHAVASSVPVEGTVADADSGQPIAGVTIYAYGLENNPELGRREEFNVETDGQGRYRMTGLPIGANELLATSDGSLPYLPVAINVRTQDGDSLVTRDFSLKRGIWLEGQVTDAASGEPVRATVDYSAMADNPFLKMAPGFEQIYTADSYRTDNAGHYRLPVLPGHGVVTVNASDPRRYPTGVLSERLASEYTNDRELLQTGTGFLFPLGFNYLASINPAATAEREEFDIRLKTAPDVVVRLLDPDGKPLSGVSITDYKEFRGFTSDDSSTPPGDVYLARNYLATQPRRLIAWHPERNLAGQLFIREQPSGESKFTLQPAGAVRGRVVDDEGRPRPVRFIRSLTNVPSQPEYGLLPGTEELQSSNRDGEFEFRWLIPGVKYRVAATHPTAGRFLGLLLDGVTVVAGETRELGDVKLERERP